MKVQPDEDQDPIFDHANAVKAAVTTSALVLTPPAGCKFVRVTSDLEIVVNTAGAAATDGATGGGALIPAGSPEIIPVTAGVGVYVLSTSGASAAVRITPYKRR